MNSQVPLSSRLVGQHTMCGAAILTALIGIMPLRAIADQGAVGAPASSVTDVSLTDRNLSTPAGMRLARDRLQTVAERVCADRGGGHEPPSSHRPASRRAWTARWPPCFDRSTRSPRVI